jgi:hypothetical protein
MIELAATRSQWPQHSYFSSGRYRVHFQQSSAGVNLCLALPYIVLSDEFALTTEHDIASALSRSTSMQRRSTFLASLLAAAQIGAGGRALASASSVGKVASAAATPPSD